MGGELLKTEDVLNIKIIDLEYRIDVDEDFRLFLAFFFKSVGIVPEL